jgi:hypothetical protein
MKSSHQLRRWLAREVLGKEIGRKPPQKASAIARGPERSEPYKAWVRTLPCCACGIEGRSEAAHTGSDGGMSLKAADTSCIPLCAECHTLQADSYHRHRGGRKGFERQYRLNCARLVKRLNAEWRKAA